MGAGAMLLQMLQQQQHQRQQQVFPGPQPGAMPGYPGPLSGPGMAQSLGLQQPFAPVGQAQRPTLPPFSVGGGGAPQAMPSEASNPLWCLSCRDGWAAWPLPAELSRASVTVGCCGKVGA